MKFLEYQRLDSLREYVLVSQTAMRIETWLRMDDGAWHQTVFSGPEALARFESVNCSIPVANIYEGVSLEGYHDGVMYAMPGGTRTIRT